MTLIALMPWQKKTDLVIDVICSQSETVTVIHFELFEMFNKQKIHNDHGSQDIDRNQTLEFNDIYCL